MTSTVPSSGDALLQSIASANPALYSHLAQLISHLIQHKPSDPFNSFEKLSSHILSPPATPHPILSSTPTLSLTSFLTSSPYLFIKPPPPVKAEDDEEAVEEEAVPIPAFIPDISALSSLLREAGAALSDEEVVLVDRAVVQLGQREGVESIRFWGKVITVSGNDYFIFEVKKASYDEEEEKERVAREKAVQETGDDLTAGRELLGSGANEFLYFVCQQLAEHTLTFTQLPSTCPRFIIDARSTHRLLTGDLTAPVAGFPRFAGLEADLLRAQIARITQGTVVVPKDSWKEEEGEVIIENEEWKGAAPGQSIEWAHVRGHLRRDGRVEVAAEEDEDDEEEEDEAKKAAKAAAKAAAFEAKRPLLAPVAPSSFTSRVSSSFDPSCIIKPKDGEEEGERGVSGLVHACWSTVWPGSVSVLKGKEYASVYMGWGVRVGLGRVDRLTERQQEWAGDLVEQAEVLATEDELKQEHEADEERKLEQGDKQEEDEQAEDELPGDEEDDKKDEEEEDD